MSDQPKTRPVTQEQLNTQQYAQAPQIENNKYLAMGYIPPRNRGRLIALKYLAIGLGLLIIVAAIAVFSILLHLNNRTQVIEKNSRYEDDMDDEVEYYDEEESLFGANDEEDDIDTLDDETLDEDTSDSIEETDVEENATDEALEDETEETEPDEQSDNEDSDADEDADEENDGDTDSDENDDSDSNEESEKDSEDENSGVIIL